MEDYVIIPPDGGWGWIVVFAAFYCQMVLDGIMLTFGMILDEVAHSYNSPQSSVAFVGSIMYGTHYLAGPMCAALSYAYGERAVCVFGSVLTALGLFVAYFEPPLSVFIFSAGLGGVGLCFLNMNSIVVTTLYFSRRRILAMGIVVCGTGAGTIFFTYLAYIVTLSLEWNYVCLIQAGFALSAGLASLTFRPLQPSLVRTDLSVESAVITTEVVDFDNEVENNSDATIFYIRKFEDEPKSEFEGVTEQGLEDIAVHIAHPSVRTSRYQVRCCLQITQRKKIILMNPIFRQRVLVTNVEHGVRKMSTADENAAKGGSCLICLTHFLKTDKQLLKSVPLLLYCVSGALSASALLIVLYYEKTLFIVDGGTEAGAMQLMMFLGGINMFWRLVLGLISMLPKINYQLLHLIGLIIGGTATAASSLSSSLEYDYFCGAVYGFGIGCFAVLLPVELFELVGAERISYATGVSMLFMGVFSAIGAPLAGSCFYSPLTQISKMPLGLAMEVTGSYHTTFYIAGGMFIMSGFLLLIVKYGFKPKH